MSDNLLQQILESYDDEYSCPFLGCRFPAKDAMLEMQTCRICCLQKASFNIHPREAENLFRRIEQAAPTKQKTIELPKVIPILPINDHTIASTLNTETIIVQFYELLDKPLLQEIFSKGVQDALHYNGKVILSSIMPDDLLAKHEIFRQFSELAIKGLFDAVIGWDSPVYLDAPTYDSWANLIKGLELTYRLSKLQIFDIAVYPLAKGNTQEQISFSVDSLHRLGFRDIALHVSQYMQHLQTAPRADALQTRHILYSYLYALKNKIDKLILIGATSLPALDIVRSIFYYWDQTHISGLSWYLDALNYIVYTNEGELNLNGSFLEYHCPACTSFTPSQLASSHRARALDNIHYITKVANGGREESENDEIREYDLIAEKGQTLIVSDLLIGAQESLYRNFLTLLRNVSPQHLILLGNTFDFRRNIRLEQVTEFFQTMRKVQPITAVVRGCIEKDEAFLKRIKRVAFEGLHQAYSYRDKPNTDQYLVDFLRLYGQAKNEIIVKLLNGETIHAEHGDKIFEDEDLTADQKHIQNKLAQYKRKIEADWLIVGHTHRAFLNKGEKVASPGAWTLPPALLKPVVTKHDIDRAILIKEDGELTLIYG